MSTLRLSRDQRRRLFDRDPVRISGVGDCPVKAGDKVTLSSRVWLEIKGVRHKPGRKWVLRYELHDRRDPVRNLRRTPGIAQDEFRAIHDGLDEYGMPCAPTPDRLKDAAEESAYTARPSSLADAGEAIPADAQARFTKEAQQTDAARERGRHERWEAQSLADRVAALESVDSADVSRFLASIERRVQAAERKVRQRAA